MIKQGGHIFEKQSSLRFPGHFKNFSLSNSREENSMECIFVGDHVTKFHFP